jgi:hypothetical protein
MATKEKAAAPVRIAPAIPAEAALSFLKDTKGALDAWTAAELAGTLNLGRREADQVVALLEAQGYVRRQGSKWMTTPAGESISGAKPARFTPEGVQEALDALAQRIKEVNKDRIAAFTIAKAVAFGDFLLTERTRVQAADVGVGVVRREDKAEPRSFTEAREEKKFLRQLRAKSAMLNVLPYAEWMSRRTHRKLV